MSDLKRIKMAYFKKNVCGIKIRHPERGTFIKSDLLQNFTESIMIFITFLTIKYTYQKKIIKKIW